LDEVDSTLEGASERVSANVDESVANIQGDGFSEEAAQESVADFQGDIANSDFVSNVESPEDAVGIKR
jgi:hypothetical protein